jgi:hypothetical protein
MVYILKQKSRTTQYQYFVRLAIKPADNPKAVHSPLGLHEDLPCSRHSKQASRGDVSGICRCRWYGDGIIRGTKDEATVYGRTHIPLNVLQEIAAYRVLTPAEGADAATA